jgi:hypothetical protein
MGLDGTRAYTRDGGATWTVANDMSPKLRFVTNIPGTETYIAVGSTGASLISKDGGVTWTELTGAPTQHLYGVEASANVVWACGNAGTIIKMNITTDVNENELNGPKEYELCQNYPNPFNPTTKIKYTIPTSPSVSGRLSQGEVLVTLKVYDILGNEVALLVNEEQPAGEYEVEMDGSKLTSGIYFYEFHAGQFVFQKKMMLIK